MTDEQYYNLKWKLPDLLYGYIKQGQKDRLKASLNVNNRTFLNFLCAEDFPTEKELKGFCEEFKLSYSTLKTWNVLHLVDYE